MSCRLFAITGVTRDAAPFCEEPVGVVMTATVEWMVAQGQNLLRGAGVRPRRQLYPLLPQSGTFMSLVLAM